MFPKSRGAWYLLNVGVFVLGAGVLVSIALAEATPGWWLLTFGLLAVFAFVFFVAKAEREDEERKEGSRLERESSEPLAYLSEETERAAAQIQRWSTWLAVAGVALAALVAVGGCAVDPSESRVLVLSALVWLILAAAAWTVRSRMSRVGSVVLFLVPAADLAAVLFDADQRSEGGLLVPGLLAFAAARCCQLTFRYHRALRLGV